MLKKEVEKKVMLPKQVLTEKPFYATVKIITNSTLEIV